MQVTCGDCGKRASVPDADVRDPARRDLCSLCGAELPMEAARDQLDTLRLDSSSLATLVSLGEATHAAAAGEPGAARPAQASIPFELARERAVPLTAPRAPQASIPFELLGEAPVPLAHGRPALPSEPFALRRDALADATDASGATDATGAIDDWEETFAARVRKRRGGWRVALLVIGAVSLLALVALLGLVASGRVDPWRLLD